MTTITITKHEGKLVGASKKDARAYARFRKKLDELEDGELFTISTWFPRQGWLHRKHFALLTEIFDAQEQFADPDQLRMWLEVGAGHCDYVPGPTGRMVAIPRSIKYSKMDDADFEALHWKTIDFMRSEHAQNFLWPHLDAAKKSEMCEHILSSFEQSRT